MIDKRNAADDVFECDVEEVTEVTSPAVKRTLEDLPIAGIAGLIRCDGGSGTRGIASLQRVALVPQPTAELGYEPKGTTRHPRPRDPFGFVQKLDDVLGVTFERNAGCLPADNYALVPIVRDSQGDLAVWMDLVKAYTCTWKVSIPHEITPGVPLRTEDRPLRKPHADELDPVLPHDLEMFLVGLDGVDPIDVPVVHVIAEARKVRLILEFEVARVLRAHANEAF